MISDIEVNNLIVQPDASLVVDAGKAITINGVVNGNVLYKRHANNTTLPDESGSNDLISPPLSGQPFDEFVTTIGNTNIVSNSTNTLYLFGPFNKEFGTYRTYANTETAALEAATGYRAASTDNSTFTFTGTVNTGIIPVVITNSGPAYQQWNLIGNPYPSYIDLETFLSTHTFAFAENSTAIYGYDGDASDGWVVWNQAYAPSHTDALITPGQGFFLATESEEVTINFLPSMRVKGTSDDFIAGRSASSLPGFLTLSLNQNDKKYHTYFYFNPNASRGLDKGYDAQIWGGSAPDLGLFSYLVEENAGLPMAIQSVGENDFTNIKIPLGINANAGEQISISIFENTLPSTIAIYLEDQLSQTLVQLNNSGFVFTPSIRLNSLGRFFLTFRENALATDTSIFDTLNIFNDVQTQSIVISGLITESTTAQLYDVQSRKVLSNALQLYTTTQHIDISGLEKGVYIISIQSVSEKITKKLIIR